MEGKRKISKPPTSAPSEINCPIFLPQGWTRKRNPTNSGYIYVFNNKEETTVHPFFQEIEFQAPFAELPTWNEDTFLELVITEAKDLVNKRMFGKPNPFVIAQLDETTFQTQIKKKDVNPKWNESTTFECFGPEYSTVHLEVWDYHKFKKNSFLGMANIPVLQIPKQQKSISIKLAPSPSKKSSKPITGEILVSGSVKLGPPKQPLYDDPKFTETKGLFSAPIKFYKISETSLSKDQGGLTIQTHNISLSGKEKGNRNTFHLLDLRELSLVGPGKIIMIFQESEGSSLTLKIFTKKPEELIRAIRIAAGVSGYTNPSTYWFRLRSPSSRILPISFNEGIYEGLSQKIQLWLSYNKQQFNAKDLEYLQNLFDFGILDITNPPFNEAYLNALLTALKFNSYFRSITFKEESNAYGQCKIQQAIIELLKYNTCIRAATFSNCNLLSNHFTELGKFFQANRKQYHSLDFSLNNIGQNESFIEGLAHLNLISLNLDKCYIQPMNLLLNKLVPDNLQSLSLASNPLETMAEPLSLFLNRATCLKYLNLASTKLPFVMFHQLPPSLTDLDISFSVIQSVEDFKSFIKYLSTSSIHTLKMNGVLIYPQDIALVIQSLTTNPKVASLFLEFDQTIVGELYKHFSGFLPSLKGNTKLQSLSIASNVLPNKSMENILLALMQSPIKKLNLSMDFHKKDACGGSMKILADALSSKQTLTSLNLRGNPAKDLLLGNHLQILFPSLAVNRSLTYLNLEDNSFGDAGATSLATALRKNRSITALYIDGNFISLEGFKKLRGALYGNKKLVDVPLPKRDLNYYLQYLTTQVTTSESKLTQAKQNIKVVIRRYGKFSKEKSEAVELIKQAKRGIRVNTNLIEKTKQITREMMQDVNRNHQIYQAKKSQKNLNSTSKHVQKLLVKKTIKAFNAVSKVVPIITPMDEKCANTLGTISLEVLNNPSSVSVKIIDQCLSAINNSKPEVIKKCTKAAHKLKKLRKILQSIYHPYLASALLSEFDDPDLESDKPKRKKQKKTKKEEEEEEEDVFILGEVDDGMDSSSSESEEDKKLEEEEEDKKLAEEEEEEDKGEHEEPEDKEVLVDMYGSAGPRDLDDGGPDFERADKNPSPTFTWTNEKIDHFFSETLEQHYLSAIENEQQKNDLLVPQPTHKQQLFLKSSLPRHENDITLVTQCSLDRLSHLEQQAKNWTGILSVAILLIQNSTLAHQKQQLVEFHERVEREGTCRLDIAIIIENAADLEQHLYPINSLRNLALAQASTDLVFLVDVDFIPSSSMHQILTDGDTYSTLLKKSKSKTTPCVFVVPAFELNSDILLPRHQPVLPSTKSQIVEMYKNQQVVGFHTGHFAPGHKATNFEYWITTDSIYQVKYQEGFEPYIIGSRKALPRYNEQFRGYGMNKITHLFEVNEMGFNFLVLPQVFVVSLPHPPSSSYKKTFGSQRDEMRILFLKALYSSFKKAVSLKYKIKKKQSSNAECSLPSAGNEEVDLIERKIHAPQIMT